MEEGKEEPQKQSFWSRLFGRKPNPAPPGPVNPEHIAQEPAHNKVDATKTSWDSEPQNPEFEATTSKVLRSLEESPPDSPEDGITSFWKSAIFLDIPDSNLGEPKKGRAFDQNGTYYTVRRDVQNADGVKTGVWEKYGLLKGVYPDKKIVVVLESTREDNGNAREIAAVFNKDNRIQSVYEILGKNDKTTKYTRAELAYTPEGTLSNIRFKNEEPSGYIPGYAARLNLQPAPKQ